RLLCLWVTGAVAVPGWEGSARRAIVSLAVAGLLIAGGPKRFVVVTAPTVRPSPAEAALRLDLPITDEGDAGALYQQMFDPKPLYNGFSGFTAPHYAAMKALLDEGDPEILSILAARGSLGIVVDHAADADGVQRAMVLAFPGSKTVRTERDWSSYLIPRVEAAPVETADASGSTVRIEAVSASAGKGPAQRAIDGDLDTAWSGGKDV